MICRPSEARRSEAKRGEARRSRAKRGVIYTFYTDEHLNWNGSHRDPSFFIDLSATLPLII